MSSRQTHQIDTAKKFVSGLKRHNINANLEIGFKKDNRSDLVLVWGMRGARMVRTDLKKDFLLMERSYLEDRFEWISLGYNGLNGKGEFYNKNMPDDRWKKHFNDGRLKEWHPADLAGKVIDELLDRSGADPEMVEDVIMGCVSQVGQQAANIGRLG